MGCKTPETALLLLPCLAAGRYRLITGFKLLLHDPDIQLLQSLPPGLTVLQVTSSTTQQGWRC